MSIINPMSEQDAYFWAHRKEAKAMDQWLKRNEQRDDERRERGGQA